MFKRSFEKNKLKTTVTIDADGRIYIQDSKPKDPNDLIIGYTMLTAIVQHGQKTGNTFEITEEKTTHNTNYFTNTHVFKNGNNVNMLIKSTQSKDSFNNDGRDISLTIETKEPDELLDFLMKKFDIAGAILDKRQNMQQNHGKKS